MQYRTMVETPKGKVIQNANGKATLRYNKEYFNKFNTELNQVQVYLDKRVANNLMAYVSFKTGTQQKSIPISSDYGSGYVTINVPYATYQAYSKKIKKRVGKRGTYPFERMCADKKSSIYKEVLNYARRVHNG